MTLHALPLGVAAQFLRSSATIKAKRGTQDHQLTVPRILFQNLHQCLKASLGIMSINSFASVIGGIQYLIDISLGLRLDPQLGRFFEPSKSDPASVNAWEGKLSMRGAKSLDRLSAEERKAEVLRRESGALAAKDAVQKAISAGGELTIGPLVSADSNLSASIVGFYISNPLKV